MLTLLNQSVNIILSLTKQKKLFPCTDYHAQQITLHDKFPENYVTWCEPSINFWKYLSNILTNKAASKQHYFTCDHFSWSDELCQLFCDFCGLEISLLCSVCLSGEWGNKSNTPMGKERTDWETQLFDNLQRHSFQVALICALGLTRNHARGSS